MGHFEDNGGIQRGGYAARQQFVRKGVRNLTRNLMRNLTQNLREIYTIIRDRDRVKDRVRDNIIARSYNLLRSLSSKPKMQNTLMDDYLIMVFRVPGKDCCH